MKRAPVAMATACFEACFVNVANKYSSNNSKFSNVYITFVQCFDYRV
jgi:hypothetical protein